MTYTPLQSCGRAVLWYGTSTPEAVHFVGPSHNLGSLATARVEVIVRRAVGKKVRTTIESMKGLFR